MKCVEPSYTIGREDLRNEMAGHFERIPGYSILSNEHSRVPRPTLFGIRVDTTKLAGVARAIISGMSNREAARKIGVNRRTANKVKKALEAYLGPDGLYEKQCEAVAERIPEFRVRVKKYAVNRTAGRFWDKLRDLEARQAAA